VLPFDSVTVPRDNMEKKIENLDHFLGNPIFAIETNLDPLRKRIREGRIEEALAVVDSIQASVEQAKTAIHEITSNIIVIRP